MNDIWLVTSGEYSSYGVDAAFSTEEAANAYAAVMNEQHLDTQHLDTQHLDTQHLDTQHLDTQHLDTHRVERIDLDPPLPTIVREIIMSPTTQNEMCRCRHQRSEHVPWPWGGCELCLDCRRFDPVPTPQPMTTEERNALVDSIVLPGDLDCGRE